VRIFGVVSRNLSVEPKQTKYKTIIKFKNQAENRSYHLLPVVLFSDAKFIKMNRLLINMKNKIDIINGAIDMIYRLKKGETIKLNGLHSFSVTAKENNHVDFNKRLCELFEERENLQIRVNRMRG
jgi:hypothetical protein